ncbi:hypothetical protein CS542_05395 [Pedobacter sp. IW39]|nr:hypothetical protein CS542_05395 [Pedobacter sp. IW39]
MAKSRPELQEIQSRRRWIKDPSTKKISLLLLYLQVSGSGYGNMLIVETFTGLSGFKRYVWNYCSRNTCMRMYDRWNGKHPIIHDFFARSMMFQTRLLVLEQLVL